jgi:nicotinamidase-related amidase
VPWEHPKFEIAPGKAAMLVIDVQNDFVAPGAPYESGPTRDSVDHLNELSAMCREHGIPVIFTAHHHRADGSDLGAVKHLHPLTATGAALKEGTGGVELYPKLDVQESDYVVVKRRYSGFYQTDLELLLRNLGVDTLIIAGVATNVCCESTARDAYFRDFKVVFLTDGTGTFDHPDVGWGAFPADDVQAHTLTNIAMFFGDVASIEDVKGRILASARAAGSAG